MSIINKRELFHLAWTLAKEGSSEYGGSSKLYFAEALKTAWAEIRKPKVHTYEMPEWFLRNTAEKRKRHETFAPTFTEKQILRNTDKAVLAILQSTDINGRITSQAIWVPKSILT